MIFGFGLSKRVSFRQPDQEEHQPMAATTSTGWRLDDGQIEVVDPLIADVLREKSPTERAAMIFDANRTVRRLIAGQLRTDHPDWSDEEISAEVARRMLHGPD